MKTVWIYSKETEAQRILNTACSMSTGFFRINNFFVLPYSGKEKYPSQVVRFPDLPYNKIPRFWEKVKNIDLKEFPYSFNKRVTKQVTELVTYDHHIGKPKFEAVQKRWQKAQEQVIKAIAKIYPGVKKLTKVTIYPTTLGTSCSFSYKLNSKGEMYIYLRDDQDIYAITEAILTCLTRSGVYDDLEGTWSESELLVDWLILKSPIAKVLKKYQPRTSFNPTLKGIKTKQSAQLMKNSEEFYARLGIPVTEKPFSINGHGPEVFKKPLENLTEQEKLILTHLIENSGNVTSMDQIGEIMFESENDFSLWAIAKSIQRIRDKLELNGVSGSYIQTLRGQGYILKN